MNLDFDLGLGLGLNLRLFALIEDQEDDGKNTMAIELEVEMDTLSTANSERRWMTLSMHSAVNQFTTSSVATSFWKRLTLSFSTQCSNQWTLR